MQQKKVSTQKRYVIAEKAARGLTADGFETRPGWCQRWVKQVLLASGLTSLQACEGAASAGQAFTWYQDMGWLMPAGTRVNIGDILYKVGPRHGKFGHVGIYIGENKVAENSSYHVNGKQTDARGVRSLQSFGACRIVRVWGQ